MKYYIGDTHFGHSNVIKFDGRPFSDREEMDRIMIQLWNSRVQKNDEVYILGDFCYRSDKTEEWYLGQLQGKKNLVIGNHDNGLLNNPKAMAYFESVDKMMHVKDEEKDICLCHFPIAQWHSAHKGSWHIYGHIHNERDEVYEFMRRTGHALNAGCMINNFMPVSFRELLRNNQIFWEEGDVLLNEKKG